MAAEASLAELRERLAEAKHQFELAVYIDSYERMKRERDHWAEQIRLITGRVWKAEQAEAAAEIARRKEATTDQ